VRTEIKGIANWLKLKVLPTWIDEGGLIGWRDKFLWCERMMGEKTISFDLHVFPGICMLICIPQS